MQYGKLPVLKVNAKYQINLKETKKMPNCQIIIFNEKVPNVSLASEKFQLATLLNSLHNAQPAAIV